MTVTHSGGGEVSGTEFTERRLDALLICGDLGIREGLQTALVEQGSMVEIKYLLDRYPNAVELMRAVRSQSPDLVLLSFERSDLALQVIQLLEEEATGLPVIGLHEVCQSEVLRQGMRAGVRGFLTPPFAASEVATVLADVRELLSREPLDYSAKARVFSFLPSKPGVGTTTLAMNLSAAIQRVAAKRVLLTDLDLCNGIIRFLLKLPSENSIVEAMLRSPEMDLNLWPQLIVRRDGVDILHSGSANPQTYFEPSQIQYLLDFARRNYDVLCFDFSGNMEQHCLRVMEDSTRIFLVVTPEPASLQLASERLRYLTRLKIQNRVGILLNRFNQKLAIPPEKVEDLLQVPVAAVFSNAYQDVTTAIGTATWVEDRCRLGRELATFAAGLFDDSLPARKSVANSGGGILARLHLAPR